MTTRTARALAATSLAVLAYAPAQAQELNKLNAAETAAGFRLMWDGTTAGRSTLLKAGLNGTSNTWGIDDNGIKDPNNGDPVSNGGDAFLYSKEKYENFEWRLDFKVNAGGNSGVFIRTGNDWYCDGFEVGILDSKSGGDNGVDGSNRSHPDNGDVMAPGTIDPATGAPFSKGGQVPIKRSGGIYDMYPTTKDGILIKNGGVWVDRMKPADQWNSMVIWANGNFVETWLNGMKVTDFEIGSTEYMNRFHRSKFGNGSNQCGDDFGKLANGFFAVQDHGGSLRVWLRNLKVRPFTPGSKLPSPVAVPNGGTFAGATKVKLDAGVTGAVIRYTLDGSEPTESSPIYNDSTGLSVTSTSVVKSKAFRARFTASDVASANFTISGSGVNGEKLTVVPEVEFEHNAGQLHLRSRNGLPFSIDLISLHGEVVKSMTVGDQGTVTLTGLNHGIYLARMKAGAWLHTKLVAIQ